MEILKRWIRSLFGSSRSSIRKTAKKNKSSKKSNPYRAQKINKRALPQNRRRPIPAKAKDAGAARRSKVAFKKSRQKPIDNKDGRKPERFVFIGGITHYFPKVNAAAVKVEKSGLEIGKTVRIEGPRGFFEQLVLSLQKDCEPIKSARKGEEIGLEVQHPVHEEDTVYLIKK